MTVESTGLKHDWNPEYGKVSNIESNETFFGNIPVKMLKNITDFQYTFVLKPSEGKVMMTKTVKPCERKRDTKFESLLATMFDFKNIDDWSHLAPFIWVCPIIEGDRVILSRPKQFTFPLMVPSFLSTPGVYDWQEVYKTKENDKLVVFLKITKIFKITLL